MSNITLENFVSFIDKTKLTSNDYIMDLINQLANLRGIKLLDDVYVLKNSNIIFNLGKLACVINNYKNTKSAYNLIYNKYSDNFKNIIFDHKTYGILTTIEYKGLPQINVSNIYDNIVTKQIEFDVYEATLSEKGEMFKLYKRCDKQNNLISYVSLFEYMARIMVYLKKTEFTSILHGSELDNSQILKKGTKEDVIMIKDYNNNISESYKDNSVVNILVDASNTNNPVFDQLTSIKHSSLFTSNNEYIFKPGKDLSLIYAVSNGEMYKSGRSNNLKRPLYDYSGYKLHFVYNAEKSDLLRLENIYKSLFNSKYKKGNEYFVYNKYLESKLDTTPSNEQCEKFVNKFVLKHIKWMYKTVSCDINTFLKRLSITKNVCFCSQDDNEFLKNQLDGLKKIPFTNQKNNLEDMNERLIIEKIEEEISIVKSNIKRVNYEIELEEESDRKKQKMELEYEENKIEQIKQLYKMMLNSLNLDEINIIQTKIDYFYKKY